MNDTPKSTYPTEDEYSSVCKMYDKLGNAIAPILSSAFDDASIPYLAITKRVKAFESFSSKIGNKHYENPMEDIEDICGIRVITYFLKDIEKIRTIIHENFEVLEDMSKEEAFKENEVGYRSHHFIVKLKNEWIGVPPYKGLGELKAEIQVRTILMHAWAEIEHKLSYKQKESIPTHLQRGLNLLSGSLEMADTQFQNFQNEVGNYVEEVKQLLKQPEEVKEEIQLDINSLQTYLDTTYPDTKAEKASLSYLLRDLSGHNLGIPDLLKSHKKYNKIIRDNMKVIKELTGHGGPVYFNSVGLARLELGVTHPETMLNKFPDALIDFLRSLSDNSKENE